MPVASSYSAAVAAARQGPADELDLFLKPLLWGALREGRRHKGTT